MSKEREGEVLLGEEGRGGGGSVAAKGEASRISPAMRAWRGISAAWLRRTRGLVRGRPSWESSSTHEEECR